MRIEYGALHEFGQISNAVAFGQVGEFFVVYDAC